MKSWVRDCQTTGTAYVLDGFKPRRRILYQLLPRGNNKKLNEKRLCTKGTALAVP
jgi:hypothetical protein